MTHEPIELSGLPAKYYRDPVYLEQEIQAHFVDGWPSIGAAQMVPNAGDVYPVNFAGHPLLVTRDRDSQVHVFHNVCRHRGTQLLTEPSNRGNGLITCPYHAWSYKLDGKLAAAPKCGVDSAGKEKLGLVPVRTAIWMDIIFVNLSGTAQPFDEFIQPLAERWAKFDFSLLHLAMHKQFPTACNWKIIAENLVDTLHVPSVHPQMGIQDVTSYEHELSFLSRDIIAYMATNVGEALGGYLSYPTFPDGPPGFETGMDMMYIFPNTSVLFSSTFVQVSVLHPHVAGAIYENFGYLIGAEAAAQEGESLAAALSELAMQDMDIMHRQQAGRGGDVSDQGHMVPHWDQLQAVLFKRIVECYTD